MKNKLCLIAILAVIGFLAACSTGDDGTTTVSVTGVTLNQKSISLTVGGTANLTATVAPENATNKAVTWSSSNATKATVSTNGVVTAVSAGTATITVTTADGNKTDTCSITITATTASLDHITAEYAGVEAIFPDTTLHTLKDDLTVKAHYSDNTETTLEMEDYELSGTLTVGSSIITVSYQGKTTTITVTVHATHAHSWGNWETITQATCTEEGEKGRHCTADPPHSETLSLPIDLINGHDWGDWITTPATYIADGVETRTCNHDATHKETRTGDPQLIYSTIGINFIPLRDYLSTLPANTPDDPYTIKLSGGSIGNSSGNGHLGQALYQNSTKYVNIDLSGMTLTSFGNQPTNSFYNCTSLISVTIGNTVTSIGAMSDGNAAFDGCTRLIAINVDAGNTAYSSQDGVLYNKTKTTLIRYPEGKTGASFAIPNSVTSIGEGAFYNCTSLTSVTIGNNVTSIGFGAFYDCTNLTSVRFERVGTSIGTNVFIDAANTTSLQSAYTAGGIGTYTRPDTTSTTWTKVSN